MRSWRRLILEVPEADQESAIVLLHECGTLGVASEEGRLIAWFAAAPDDPVGRILGAAAVSPSLRILSDEQVADERWHERWMERLEPFPIGERFVVVPGAKPLPAGERIALRVTPGRAFGTGEHPTTRLCVAMLEERFRAGDSVLDAGTGSGILAIAAHRLGARPVVAIDVDEEALQVATRNATASEARGILFAAMPIEAIRKGSFDLVVANIDLGTLTRGMIALATATRRALIVSGLLPDDEGAALDAAGAAGLAAAERRAMDGWIALALVPEP